MFHGVVHPWRTTWISVLIKSETSCSLLPICASLNSQWKEGHTPHGSIRKFCVWSKRKKKLWHQLKAQPSQSLRQKFKDLRSTVKKIIRSEYHKYLQHLSDVLKENLKRFWFYHSIKSKSKRLVGTNVWKPFRLRFYGMINQSHKVHNIQDYKCAYCYTDSVSCNTVEVERILQKIDASKSSGEDKIPARQLKETAHLSAISLSVLYNLSFMKSQVPTLWKLNIPTSLLFIRKVSENQLNITAVSHCCPSQASVKKDFARATSKATINKFII